MEVDGRQGSGADESSQHQVQPHRGHEPHHHEHGHHRHKPMDAETAVKSLLLLGQVALNSRDYESAVDAFASILKIEPNETAYYNLGSFYARGLGVKRDFVEGARLFHLAELMGNERAGTLCAKCMLDYISDGLESRSPADLYAEMALFVTRVYPESTDQKLEVSNGLLAIAYTYLNKGDYTKAAKVFRAAAEFGSNGDAQYYLAELHSAGAGVDKDDLAALYWFDCAVDNGAAEVALEKRDDLIDAYRQSLSTPEFREMMALLSEWCKTGTPNVPANPAKATLWREASELDTNA